MALGSLTADTSQRLASDPTSLAALKTRAAQDPKGAAREAAKLLESLFMQQMLKHMRAASLDTGLDNEGSKLGTDMLDSQLALQISGKPGGLADVVARQLERQFSVLPGDVLAGAPAKPAPPTTTLPTVEAIQPASVPASVPRIPDRGAAAFIEQYSATAKVVEQQSGIPATLALPLPLAEKWLGFLSITFSYSACVTSWTPM